MLKEGDEKGGGFSGAGLRLSCNIFPCQRDR